ncbi:unnamed protein product [Didymodactylos carnosus]|uniref:RING-type domain-containing protein n=1 Tax=Didymodactylos carnosus TaxID=1234261 RepID=A0A815MIK3_9BILA|nr:unnamed protein product [Didymodactylos carnosus]CAF1425085.1 unnamed protein product [Didymodactylos carnosus]CAF3981707.1 unnamed protein product [Didymodactylos carnosus]CAF4306197.1 unnamed protein product [Didymodactylos carnosus]
MAQISIARLSSVEENNAKLVCYVCNSRSEEPTQCKHCEQMFCPQCIKASNITNSHCPSCHCLFKERNQVLLALSKLKINCENYNKGCRESSFLSEELRQHEKQCKYRSDSLRDGDKHEVLKNSQGYHQEDVQHLQELYDGMNKRVKELEGSLEDMIGMKIIEPLKQPLTFVLDDDIKVENVDVKLCQLPVAIQLPFLFRFGPGNKQLRFTLVSKSSRNEMGQYYSFYKLVLMDDDNIYTAQNPRYCDLYERDLAEKINRGRIYIMRPSKADLAKPLVPYPTRLNSKLTSAEPAIDGEPKTKVQMHEMNYFHLIVEAGEVQADGTFVPATNMIAESNVLCDGNCVQQEFKCRYKQCCRLEREIERIYITQTNKHNQYIVRFKEDIETIRIMFDAIPFQNYLQVDAVAIGPPLALILAGIFMSHQRWATPISTPLAATVTLGITP